MRSHVAKNASVCGWRGGPYIGTPFDCSGHNAKSHEHDLGHIAMTYVALAILLQLGISLPGCNIFSDAFYARYLGDDFSRVNKKAIISALPHVQQPNGSFAPIAAVRAHLVNSLTHSLILGSL